MAENLEDARRLSGGLLRPLRVTAPGRKRKLGYLPLERCVQVRCSKFSEIP